MNDNSENKNLASVHFINGTNDQLKFLSNRQQIDKDEIDNQLTEDVFDGKFDDYPAYEYTKSTDQTTNNKSSNFIQKTNTIINQQPTTSNHELDSSTFCTINSNGRIETNDQTTNLNNNNNFVNRCAETYDKYDFAIPLPFSEYKAPPKRSELSSFMHSPFSKTLDTFSKLSNLLKEESADERDDFFFKQSNNSNNISIIQESQQRFPPPALPIIYSRNSKTRSKPVTELEYDTELKFKSKLFIFERLFLSGIETNSLRRRLWPILLGIVDDENEDNWIQLTDLYNLYMQQWKSITPDQESRFTSFKEKKSMAERDVVRCDRCHPYFQQEENIELLKDILMCYIMYDFDTGYVQGMTDLAAPLLYIFEGNPVKAFWCFTGVLNLTKKNFEMEQTTVKNLLIKLFKLINLTDPCFAEFLAENDSDNCYFAFRWLICLFKREFVKADSNYDQLLSIWDILWSLEAYEKEKQKESQEEYKRQLNILEEESRNLNKDTTITSTNSNDLSNSFLGTSPPYIVQGFESNKGDFGDDLNTIQSTNRTSDSEQDETNQLTNFELFFLSISLAIIRQERDLIFTQKLDASGILKHFNTLNLNECLDITLKHATEIWYWLKFDGGEEQLYQENNCKDDNLNLGGFDLLND